MNEIARPVRGSLLVLLAGASLCLGQKPASCHKGHHEAGYRMTPMPAPPLMDGLGTTSLRMTTRSEKAQRYFQQGVKLLHCFWDFEAYRAFKEAARLDPHAAMAYWGIVQSISDYDAMNDEKQAALKKAKELMPKASDQEQYYLRAQQKQQDEDEGEEAAHREMEALIDNYPDDLDAKLFFAIGSNYGYDDDGRPVKNGLYPLMIVKTVLAEHPAHAAANHYLIHVLEAGPHADAALHAAEVLGKLAPASGHMVHMPGHIYYKLGDQERARQAFLESKKVDEDYMAREHVKTLDDWNYAHNLSYLIASDSEAGRFEEALRFAETLDKLPANPFLAIGRPTHAVTIGSTTARLQLRFGNWKAVIDHPVSIGDEKLAGDAAVSFRDAITAYARGMLAIGDRRYDEASRESDRLDAIQWRLKAAEDESEDKKAKTPGVFRLLETASLDLRGNLECASGHADRGIELLKNAVEKEKEVGYNEPPQYSRPELESLGYAYLNASKYDQAREAFEDELKLRPRSGHALYGIALSYERAGKMAAASKAFGEFLRAWTNADPSLPMMEHAQAAVKKA